MFINAATDTLHIHLPWERPPQPLVERFEHVPAANVADVFDRLLVMDSGIRPMTSRSRLVGPALPVLTRAGDNLAIHRALDDARAGDVLVVAGQADPTRALIGDLIGEIMRARGVVGAVIDGAIRDADELEQQGLSVFARCLTPAGPFKHGPGIIGATIACGGVVVGPGDLVVADSDGVSVVPAQRMVWAADRAREIIQQEAVLRDRIVASGGVSSS